MNREFIRIILACAAFWSVLFLPSIAFAASNLDCIADSRGRKLRWNSSWDKDRLDNNVEYRVINVSQIDRIPLRQITLELKAVDSAAVGSRTVVVVTEELARALCNSIVVQQDPLRFPGEAAADPSQYPFIRFTRDGWVRDDPDSGIQLGICPVGSLRFSCPEKDRLRFGGTLRTLEEELKAQVP